MTFRSIRVHIQLWYGVLLTLVVIGLLVVGVIHERETIEQRVDLELMGLTPTVLLHHFPPPPNIISSRARRANRIPEAAAPKPPIDRPPPRHNTSDEPDRKYYHVVWNESREIIARSKDLPETLTYPEEPQSGWFYRYANGSRELLHFHPSGHVGLVGISTEHLRARLHEFFWWSVAAALSLLVIAWSVGWKLVARSLRPLSDISTAARRIADGNLDERITTRRAYEELRNLSETLNNTFSRLSEAVQQQVKFTADASHELRTPLAIMLTEIQSGLRKQRTVEEYRERLETCHQVGQHMRSLIESLIQLARIDAGQEQLILDRVLLSEILSECAELLGPMAQAKGQTIETDLAPAYAMVDSAKIRQVLLNLLTNAIQKSPNDTQIFLSLEQSEREIVITVRDEGPGIPVEEQERIFKRFHQVDAAHSGEGVGLGLAISEAIVTLHQGRIFADTPPEGGARFTICLPRSHDSD